MNEIPNVNGNPRKLFLPSSKKNKKISKLKQKYKSTLIDKLKEFMT